MAARLTKWDGSEFLRTDEDIAAYIEAVLEDGDPRVIAHALGNIARARGMTAIAREAGVTREALYHSLTETGDPRLSTVVGVMKALGLKLTAKTLAS
jgi:probable addiction module antidote protein